MSPRKYKRKRRRSGFYRKAIRRALAAGADGNWPLNRLARDGMLPGKLRYAYLLPDGTTRPVLP